MTLMVDESLVYLFLGHCAKASPVTVEGDDRKGKP